MRAFYPFLMASAVLWAMPRSASAQLYVSSDIVSEYNATTGGTIVASFITGLNGPFGLAVKGKTIFVASFAANPSNGKVGEYDASTGAAINASFITGLSVPIGLALSGNTLFVTNNLSGTIGKYDAKTGAAINANFITGLVGPFGLAVKSAK